MVQVLHLSNGDTLNPKLDQKNNLIGKLLADGSSNEEIINTLFNASLCRDATPTEMASLLKVVDEYGEDRSTAMRDVAWGILTSPEFTFHR